MHLELLSKEDLLIAAIATKRPVAFLVGAPLSLKDGVGVSGVTEVLDIIREEIRGRAPGSLPKFEVALDGKSGGDAYQEAMKWLGSRMGQDAINDVIKTAVLKARKGGSGEPPKGKDGEPEDWNIPAGTIELAELAARGGEKFLGPILTTNFDPLVSLAIHSAGGHAVRHVLTGDVTLVGAAADNPGICPVIHLHGFWRDSDTLHTQAQLTFSRPKLAKSLQRLLQRRTLIVAAYGGWEDFFTKALIELMNDEQAPLDVIWCFYEDDADRVKEQYGKLLAAVEPAIVMNRFRAFGGIDCHSIFGEILSSLRGIAPAMTVPSVVSPLAGWEFIDATYLAALPSLCHEEIIRYFDGATPTWRHAVCGGITSRVAVDEVRQHLDEGRSSRSACSLQLIRAAGGEGKTTLLLQAAADAAKSGDWNVLWRPTPRIGLPPEHITNLDSSKPWLIVADDAENLVRDLCETARLLHEAGCTQVHFLLAARDVDWRHGKGDQQPWNSWLTRHADIVLRDLKPEDAARLVAAWQEFGDDGLRELATLSDSKEQVAKLMAAVSGETASRHEGSFFGGLLSVRFGQGGLRSHVIALLHRLKDTKITDSDRTLFDALLYIAACHAVGIGGIDEKVLADLLYVNRDWVQTRVVNPLGEEAAAVRSAGHVFTRHRNVAAAILVAAEQDLGADIAEIWSSVVRQTVRTGTEVQMDRYWFSSITHAAPRLQRELPPQFTKQRRKEIAVATAKADIAAEPDRLCALVDLGKTYRNADDYPKAIQVFRENLSALPKKIDFDSDVRGYWFEWGVAEGAARDGAARRAADVLLQGLSLADRLEPAPITAEGAKISCAGLGVAFGKLAEPRPDCPYAFARRAATYLGRLTNPEPKTLGYFDKHDRESDRIRTPRPKSIEEAISWLMTAVAQAGRDVQDPFLKALAKPEAISFNMFRDFLESAHSSRSATKQSNPKPPPNSAAALDGGVLLKKMLDEFEERINGGIERVLKQAWEAVPDNIPQEARFTAAKRKAGDAITRLSPSIKKQVKAYFDSTNWETLMLGDPAA